MNTVVTKVTPPSDNNSVITANQTVQGDQLVIQVSIQRGKVDPALYVDIYNEDITWPGTTLLIDNHDLERPRIIEVNMLGEVLWQYNVPNTLRRYTNPGFDAERLPNNNVLFVLPRYGVFEIDRQGKTVRSYQNSKVSHDADKLPNGNILVAWGNDSKTDAQAREVNQRGEVVWSWRAIDYFDRGPYKNIYADGWTHCNAVERLSSGNTLISLRNFNLVVEVEPSGKIARTYGEGVFGAQHDPQLLSNGNMLVANHIPVPPNNAVEIDPLTNQIVWSFGGSQWAPQLARDANRLPNGNTLICGTNQVIEVTPEGEVAWRLRLRADISKEDAPTRGFYKAERYGL